MDGGYESEEIAEVIEEAGYQYVVKAKEYSKQSKKIYSGQGIKTGIRQKTTKPFRK
jgi:signal recognition particle subunit SEC65